MKFPKSFRIPSFGLFALIMATSCVSRQDVVYFQGLEGAQARMDNEQQKSLRIKPNDLLTISVSAAQQQAALPFNLPVIGVPQGGSDMGMTIGGRQQMQTNLVAEAGTIDFPVLGKVEAAG